MSSSRAQARDHLRALTKIPPIPAHIVNKLNSIPSLSRTLQTAGKYLLYLLVLVNVRSFPFAWHIRVFLPVITLRIKYYLFRLSLLFTPKAVRTKLITEWAEALCPVGTNPFEMTIVHKSWAGIDDSDYNGHLSNSSYAKTLDAARCKIVLKSFPAFTRSKGWLALGSTHYHFIREIPMFANYEVRLTIGAWDHKWMYIISRFVTTSRKTQRNYSKSTKPSTSSTPSEPGAPRLSLRTPADDLATPANGALTPSEPAGTQAEQTARAMRALARTEEPDGATLHCIAISHMCFKHGRITVPPAVALACEGFSKPPSLEGVDESSSPSPKLAPAYSPSNPPPSWIRAQDIRVALNGSMKSYVEFVRGGWRDGEGERWWEEALGGVIEERRKANLAVLESVRIGMEGSRDIR
ncbi:hypothetical protein BV22DRAFT_1122897 [Leucogyrophana mollusca]|uniref:Uncharacterized protein n=1 Tax=Leucogyrophana mollusca TaxID=85980 RepID=A0ACB8B4Q2_9AGAM|nr:hypothetical protein BV22DRAFT_1122897 [Leucogyrophana mollusca]